MAFASSSASVCFFFSICARDFALASITCGATGLTWTQYSLQGCSPSAYGMSLTIFGRSSSSSGTRGGVGL